MNLAQLSKKEWQQLSIGAAGLAAGCAGWVGWGLSNGAWSVAIPSALLGGLIVGPLIVLLGSVNLKLNHLRGRMKRGHTSLREITNIRPLLDGPPLDYGHWAVDPFLGKVLAQQIYRHEPTHILECGSGTSTAFMAKLLNRTNWKGRITALEHLSEYAEKTEQLLEDHNVQTRTEVVHAPLTEWSIDGKALEWYGVEPTRFDEHPIDLMLVDGPPETSGPMARYPAAFVLQDHLADHCVIIIDDGDRPGEKQAARRWAELLSMELEYVGGPKGTYVLRRGA